MEDIIVIQQYGGSFEKYKQTDNVGGKGKGIELEIQSWKSSA